MEKREYWLPEAMIQHIQSFMSGKEAAQTTILSKSWYNAWLTSPNLYFNQNLQLSNNTLQRYLNSDLKIKSFKLSVRNLERNTHPLVNQVIQKAIEVGGSTGFAFELMLSPDPEPFVLPHAVLGSEALVKLSLDSCKIDYVKINCRRLKSLRLKNVVFEGDRLENVISSCPLIEDLHLACCEISSFDAENIRMPALKTLYLEHVTVNTLFFNDFSSKFPCLENLNVYVCFGFEEMRLRSHSLKLITFYEGASALKAIFDVPRLRKFLYSGNFVPSLSFENSNNWESYIQICCPIFTSEWFLELKELLTTEFKQSKVSLSLKMNSEFDYAVLREIEEHLPKPVVECKPVVENLILLKY